MRVGAACALTRSSPLGFVTRASDGRRKECTSSTYRVIRQDLHYNFQFYSRDITFDVKFGPSFRSRNLVLDFNLMSARKVMKKKREMWSRNFKFHNKPLILGSKHTRRKTCSPNLVCSSPSLGCGAMMCHAAKLLSDKDHNSET